ncbi:MAG: hypothetical protein DGJ47_000721 [Rickettsiaceae bacterium]
MHRYINIEGIALIKRFEGFSSVIYTCAAGFKTIGYGHKILPGENYSTVSLLQAEALLKKDLYSAERSVLRNLNVPLGDNQFASLVSFVFNLGGGALQRSTLRHKINSYLYKEAACEFEKWTYCLGRKSKGLLRRRLSEQSLFLTDV